jgi:hypothetical protein
MFRDYTVFLWLLKLGALVNLCLLAHTPAPLAPGVDPYLVLPAQIFFVVSLYRCLFPVRYEHNVVSTIRSSRRSSRRGCSRPLPRSLTSTSSRAC